MSKKGKKNESILYLGLREHLLDVKQGKNGVYQSSSTKHCGDAIKAEIEFEELKQQFLKKGYSIVENDSIKIVEITLDNADWHLGDDFPKDLDKSKVHVYTGFYLCWLAINDFVKLEEGFEDGLNLLINRKINPSKFYSDYFDGKFLTSQLKDSIISFTLDYYNSDESEGNYFSDYCDTLVGDEMTSLFHVEDSWKNFDDLSNKINLRYKNFNCKKLKK